MDINKHGVVYYSPIYNWSHEDVMAYIENFNIKLPPLYRWTNGFQVGTGRSLGRPRTYRFYAKRLGRGLQY